MGETLRFEESCRATTQYHSGHKKYCWGFHKKSLLGIHRILALAIVVGRTNCSPYVRDLEDKKSSF